MSSNITDELQKYFNLPAGRAPSGTASYTAKHAKPTYDPIGNARAAIAISSNGSNWRPWTTYVTGAYRGRC